MTPQKQIRVHKDQRPIILAAVFLTACAFGADQTEAPLFGPPRGFRLSESNVRVYPALSTNLTYSDNANRGDRNARSDFLDEYLPSVEFRARPLELLTLSALYEFGWHDYVKNEVKDYQSHRALFNMRVDNVLTKGLSFIANETYLQTGNSGALDNEIISFSQYEINQASARVQYEFNRFRISGRYEYGFINYFSNNLLASDYHYHTGEVEAEYRYLPEKLAFFASANETRYLRELTHVSDFDSITALAGVRGSWSKLTYSAGFGYGFAQPLHQGSSDDGPALLASLSYQPSARVTIGLNASRRFVAGVQLGATTESIVSLSSTIVLMRRMRMILTLADNISDRPAHVTVQTSTASAGVEYRLTHFATLLANYAHYDRHTENTTGDYRINEVSVGFRLAW